MSELLSKVVPLSLGAAISPTVLAVGLVILSGRRAVARGAAFVAGVLVVLSGLTALGLYGVRQAAPSATTSDVEHIVDAVVGVLLLLLALGTVLRASTHDPATPPPDDAPPTDHRPGLWGAFVLGLAMMVSNFSTILLYLPAMHLVSAADMGGSDRVVAVVLAFVITSLPATAPFLFRVLSPGVSARAFDGLHAFLARHQRQIGVGVEVVFGVYLVVKGLR